MDLRVEEKAYTEIIDAYETLSAPGTKKAHDAHRQYMDLYLKRLKDRYNWRKRTLLLHAFPYKVLGGVVFETYKLALTLPQSG